MINETFIKCGTIDMYIALITFKLFTAITCDSSVFERILIGDFQKGGSLSRSNDS